MVIQIVVLFLFGARQFLGSIIANTIVVVLRSAICMHGMLFSSQRRHCIAKQALFNSARWREDSVYWVEGKGNASQVFPIPLHVSVGFVQVSKVPVFGDVPLFLAAFMFGVSLWMVAD